MQTEKGDLIQKARAGEFDVIVHGCNCFCTMGAGIAKTIKQVFPAAYQADLATTAGDQAKLGTYSAAQVEVASKPLTIVGRSSQRTYEIGTFRRIASIKSWVRMPSASAS
jgi:type IV secretory pathway TrbL component